MWARISPEGVILISTCFSSLALQLTTPSYSLLSTPHSLLLMAGRSFSVDIVTPDRVVLSDRAVSLVATGVEGSFGILANHAPMLAELAPGEMHYRRESNNETVRLAVGGGFLQVADNQVSVLADTAERAEEIDVERARRARDAARARLSQAGEGLGADRALVETDLARATTRVKVAEG